MRILVNRSFSNDKQTIGQMLIVDGDNVVTGFPTLELPWLNNKRNISCIPSGVYTCVKRKSPSQGMCFWIKDVPGRDWILIHKGNYHTNIKGCMLVGTFLKDINKDGYVDVSRSIYTISKMLDILPDSFKIEIQ